MRTSLLKTILILSIFLISQFANATNYYVSNFGNDSNNGSQSSPWATLQKAFASVPANAGHTINLNAGTYTVGSQITLPSGVNLIGAEASTTKVNCTYAYNMVIGTMFDPEPASSAAIVINGNNTTVRGIAFNGMNKTCITGIFILNGSSLTFTELEFTGFKVCAWWMHQGYNVELTKSKFLGNNSMGNTVQAYGAIMFHRTDNFKIDGCEIRERGTHSYGIKMASKDQCDMWSCVGEWSTNFNNNNIEISNCIIDVDESGTWQNGLAPAIAIEFNSDIECLNTNIHNNWINNHISLVTWEKNRASYRVHHNVADFRWKDDGSAGVRYAYFVEANDSYFEIDHNIVLSGYYPVAQWGTNHINKDMLMHHNIFYAPQGGSGWPPFFHWNADYNGFKFYNNTIIDTKNISEIFDLEAGGLCYSNSEIKNNVIMSTSNRGNILGNSCAWNGTVSNNLFYNISAAGSNYITSNPLLVNSGDMTLSESFGLQSNSPAINSGVAITGITTDAVGAPDMGAVEYGQTPWVAGPIATTVITARGENAPNESKEKAFDESNTTKWLDFNPNSWITVQYSSAFTPTQYTIVSGNDEPTRDPKSWELKGSNNGSTWTTLNTQTNQAWTARN